MLSFFVGDIINQWIYSTQPIAVSLLNVQYFMEWGKSRDTNRWDFYNFISIYVVKKNATYCKGFYPV